MIFELCLIFISIAWSHGQPPACPGSQETSDYGPLNKRFCESDINPARISGNWTTRATSVQLPFISNITFQIINGTTSAIAYTNVADIPFDVTDSNVTNAKLVILASTGATLGAYYTLYVDQSRWVVFGDIGLGDEALRGLIYLRQNVLVWDAEEVMDTVLHKPKPGALAVVAPDIAVFNFVLPDSSGYIATSLRMLNDSDTVPVNFSMLTGAWDLRNSSELPSARPFNYQISQIDQIYPDKLRTYRMVNQTVVANISEYNLLNSNQIFRSLGPIPPKSPNVVSEYSQVFYLYIDQNCIITYEFNAPDEAVRVYAKQGANVNCVPKLNMIQLTAQVKLADLLALIQLQNYSSNVLVNWVFTNFAAIFSSYGQLLGLVSGILGGLGLGGTGGLLG